MRINQSPNWRALAVLGALLSVIIVWPTVLSMPMLTARTPTKSTNTPPPTSPISAISLSNLTSNVTATVGLPNENLTNSDYSEHQQNTNYSEYSDYGNSHLLLLNVNATSDVSIEDDAIDFDEHLTRGDIDPLYAIMIDGNVSNTRRVKKSNMVYNKRKRKKKITDDVDVSNATHLSSASISDDDNSIINSLSNISGSVSASDLTAASINSHHYYQSKRTRSEFEDDDDDDSRQYVVSTIRSSSDRSDDYFSTTSQSIDDIDVTTSELWIDDNDTYVTSTTAAARTTTTILSYTELPVLSRTDRSVHMKRGGGGGASERQRGNNRNSNGGTTGAGAVQDGGGSIKSRRLNNHNKNHNYRNNNHTNSNSSNLDRNERSTISHISGPGRKIQLYIKNRFIQLMPDGTVNGTQDDLSDYAILQRTTVDVGRIKIQGVATCLYLCMDQCGSVYGSKEFTDDCVFNESMEQHNYNTYSSTYNSNSRRIYYLALNRHGEPRKLQIPPSRSLGKLATYTKAITETVPQDRVEALIAKKFGANRVKHGIRQLCDTGKPLVELTDKNLKTRPQCTATTNSNSNSNNSNKNGQLNVPAANDKSRLSNSNLITNSSSSSTISSSSSNSSSNGHTNSSSNNNHVIKKKKKRRRCRPGENEDEHNCQRGGPQAMRKRPANANHNNNGNKLAKCKDAPPETAVDCASQKRPKKGGGKKQPNGGPKHKQNSGGSPARGGKKPNQNGRQQQQGGNNSNKKFNGKQPKNGLGGGGRTTTTTTVHPITNNKMARTPRSRSTTTTSTTTTAATTTMAAAEVPEYVNSQPVLVSGSQVNLNQTSNEAPDADETDAEATSVEDGTAEAEDDDDDDTSHLPFIGEHTQLVGGADDFLYDDDLDFLPLGLWKIFLIVWITKWFL